jgi:hypothetical protein
VTVPRILVACTAASATIAVFMAAPGTISGAEAGSRCRAVSIEFQVGRPAESRMRRVLKAVSCATFIVRQPVVRVPEPLKFGTQIEDTAAMTRELQDIARHIQADAKVECVRDRCTISGK